MKIKTLFLAILLVRTLCSTAQVVNNQAAPQKEYTLADSTSKKLENILNELEAEIDAREKVNANSEPQTFTFPNGDSYVGERKDGKANGQGTLTFSSGKYVGEWKDDKKNGQGTLTTKFGEEYSGQWKDDFLYGQCTCKDVYGRIYIGEMIAGKENGQGTLTSKDGSNYVGEWKDGKQNGQGTKTLANGGKSVGIWKDGKLFENKGEIIKVKSITELLDSY